MRQYESLDFSMRFTSGYVSDGISVTDAYGAQTIHHWQFDDVDYSYDQRATGRLAINAIPSEF